ncbi:unnamed protein product [Dibothriocephalus latus]|uniref:Uncharacterized protein n=1 Tax=Dibothriocephalus latus TaxID=60516 RepID=A0A3P7PN77_DIBLA|nr:unnamed protein product [Dibothriocephalus latus]
MDLEDVEEMSNDEVALAQNARRKSTRRNSPHNRWEPLKPDLPPPLNDQPPSEVSECPSLPQTEPPSKASECPALPQTEPPSSQVAQSSQPSSALRSCACADQRTVVKSADELHDRYLEELAEWPKFLSGLEDLANHPLQTPALSAEAVDENPVLAPFSHYLKPSSAKNSLTDDPIAVQQRIQRSYRRCVCSLISLSRRRKERHLILSGAKSDWEEWCTRERVKLMPSTAEACKSSKRDIFSRLTSFSTSTFSDQSST